MPDEPEALGLLALLLLTDARRARPRSTRPATSSRSRNRTGRSGTRTAIAEGLALLDAAMRRAQPGPYQVQAAIAACHASARDAAATDWVEIAALYNELARMVPTPVVELNRAVAIGMADGPEAGLRLVDALGGSGVLAGYHLLPATRADFLRRLDRRDEAADCVPQTRSRWPTNDAERRYLERRLAETS